MSNNNNDNWNSNNWVVNQQPPVPENQWQAPQPINNQDRIIKNAIIKNSTLNHQSIINNNSWEKF